MVDLKPFQAANKTSIFFLKKGEKTTYPVPVLEWKRKKGIGSIPPEWLLDEVRAGCVIKKSKAIPINPKKASSSWQTAPTSDLRVYSRLKGKNFYRAYRGASTEPYGVFWLNVKEVRPDGLLVIENMHERGKRQIKSVHTAIEPDLVFPALSGGEIMKFGAKSHFYVLISQDPAKRERGFGAPSVMSNLAIPKFNADNKIHMRLAELSEEAHSLVQKGKSAEEIEKEINDLVRKLWNIE